MTGILFVLSKPYTSNPKGAWPKGERKVPHVFFFCFFFEKQVGIECKELKTHTCALFTVFYCYLHNTDKMTVYYTIEQKCVFVFISIKSTDAPVS